MNADDVNLKTLLDGNKQYVVSVFQRVYSWRRSQWETLWADILELYDSSPSLEHFLGPLVLLSTPGALPILTPYLLIDGQQRITTLCLLFAALRAYARERGEDTVAERINGLYLINQYVEGSDRLKVLSTYSLDRVAFTSVIESQGNSVGSPIYQAYEFFLKALRSGDSAHQLFDLDRLENALLTRLHLVAISLAEQDSPYRIFESLNAKSVKLGQADLLRNYFFMRLPVSEHESLYEHLWEPMQAKFGNSLDEFVRDVIVKDGEFVRTDDIYKAWKRRLDSLQQEAVRRELEHLRKLSNYYATFLYPGSEEHLLLSKRLLRLKRWGGTTTYPFLLNLWEEVDAGRLTKGDLAEILRLIESFLVRRVFDDVPTNELNRLFISLYSQLPDVPDRVAAVWQALSRPGLRWPTDAEFEVGIFGYPLYKDSRPEQRRLILEALEESYEHHEPVDLSSLTIEHVMPQTLTDEWRSHLGEDASETHKRYLHTLGNLTLTGYNPDLSNSPFHEKRRLLRESHLELNREIAEMESWTQNEIFLRCLSVTARACRIWPGPKR